MTTNNDDEQLKSLLDEVICLVIIANNTNSNADIHIISCDRHEDERMVALTKKIEIPLHTFLPKLSACFQQFILNCLVEYHYDPDQNKFEKVLPANRVDPFLNDLQATRNALDAFRAAWNGEEKSVQDFLNSYPTFKDKPGPWGTTLLYSAARNNQLPVVRYLLNTMHCSVDTQNRQHIQRALKMDIITASDYKVDPSAGSTALHGACYGGHLDVVQELINHGANYFIRNQAEETPMMNALGRPNIMKYFQDLLNCGYTEMKRDLPEYPIAEMNQDRRKDCIWEYLLFQGSDELWFPFDQSVEQQLNELMIVKDGEQFQREYQWTLSQTTCMVRFLQTGDNVAWIRCRGSSILNFDCFALWQILYLKYPNGRCDRDECMSIKILDLSTIDEQEPNIQLNTWYNCDVTSNDKLEGAMNNRRKYVTFSLIDALVKFDLMNFTFTNQNQTIKGFIRWVPKLVSDIDQIRHYIIPLDTLQALSSVQCIPLTTKHFKQALQSTSNQEVFDFDDKDAPVGNEQSDSVCLIEL